MSGAQHPKVSPEGLREIQNSIYREKVLRPAEERFASGLALTNESMQRVLEGAMWQMGTEEVELGWQEARRRLDRLSKAQDYGFYTATAPSS